MKVCVRIHKEDGSVEFKNKKIEDDGKITLRKRRKGRPEWRPKVTWTETKHLSLSRAKYYTDVFQDALETFQINVKDQKVERPELDQSEVTRIAKSKVFEKRYMTEAKQGGQTALYILFGAQIMTIILLILIARGAL